LDPQSDFLGHVGGDDFLVVFQSHDWHARLVRAIEEFNERVKTLYDAAGITAGGIQSEDRHGVRRFFSFIRLYAGVVESDSAGYRNSSEISTAASAARQIAKTQGSDIYCDGLMPKTQDVVSSPTSNPPERCKGALAAQDF
jgi:GGDEF domain-containing protein